MDRRKNPAAAVISFVVVIKISSESCFTHCQYLWVWKNFFFVEAGVLLNFRILRATVLPVNWSQNRGKIFRLCKPPQKWQNHPEAFFEFINIIICCNSIRGASSTSLCRHFISSDLLSPSATLFFLRLPLLYKHRNYGNGKDSASPIRIVSKFQESEYTQDWRCHVCIRSPSHSRDKNVCAAAMAEPNTNTTTMPR